MKKILIVLIAISFIACSSPKSDGFDGELVGKFGEEITADGMISTQEMAAMLSESDSIHVKVQGEITATCAMNGCWMNLVLSTGEEMRVTFKDYGFFVPKEGMEGNVAIIEGTITKTVTDVATLQHYAQDAGKSEQEILAITEEKEELAFEATGVLIYDVAGGDE